MSTDIDRHAHSGLLQETDGGPLHRLSAVHSEDRPVSTSTRMAWWLNGLTGPVLVLAMVWYMFAYAQGSSRVWGSMFAILIAVGSGVAFWMLSHERALRAAPPAKSKPADRQSGFALLYLVSEEGLCTLYPDV